MAMDVSVAQASQAFLPQPGASSAGAGRNDPSGFALAIPIV
jgi:hypothetical protein